MMKKNQINNILPLAKKSAFKDQKSQQTVKVKSNIGKSNIVEPKSTSGKKNLARSKTSERAGYSSVSKDKSSAKSLKTEKDNPSQSALKTRVKSPHQQVAKVLKSKIQSSSLKRRNALKPEEVNKIKSLSKETKRDGNVKLHKSSDRVSKKNSTGRGEEITNNNIVKTHKIVKNISTKKRIDTLNEGDEKNVSQFLDKLKGTSQRKAKQKNPVKIQASIQTNSSQSKPVTKRDIKQKEVKTEDTESSEEIVNLIQTSSKKTKEIKKVAHKNKDRNLERSRDEKISKERKHIKNIDLSTEKQKNSLTENSNIIKATPKQEKTQIKEESSQQSKHIIKKSPFTQQSPKKVSSEEISISEESEKKSKASREKKILKKPIKQQLTSALDTSQISDEISRIIKRIEEKRKKTGSVSDKKRTSKSKLSSSKRDNKNATAEINNNKLQLNKNIKIEQIIDISELTTNENIPKTSVLLALIEIACNTNYYSLGAFHRSRSFWVDVLNYPELKKIFDPLKAETLKKYWININIAGDPRQVADFVKKYKDLFEEYKIAVLPMISTAIQYFQGKIQDINIFIKNLPKEPSRIHVITTETIDRETGKIKTETKKTLTSYKRTRHPEPITRKFVGKNNKNEVDEIIEGIKNLREADSQGNFNIILSKIEQDEELKREFLLYQKEQEKKTVFSINDEDKFIFKTIEEVVKKLNKFFPNYSDAFILESLKGNSFNIYQTYKYLTDPKANSNLIFNDADDEILRNMKNTDYFTKLCDDKGKSNVFFRIDYLNLQ